ncbi:unnamed protein product, partial [Ectocarpus sp. 13 AM-2016]
GARFSRPPSRRRPRSFRPCPPRRSSRGSSRRCPRRHSPRSLLYPRHSPPCHLGSPLCLRGHRGRRRGGGRPLRGREKAGGVSELHPCQCFCGHRSSLVWYVHRLFLSTLLSVRETCTRFLFLFSMDCWEWLIGSTCFVATCLRLCSPLCFRT